MKSSQAITLFDISTYYQAVSLSQVMPIQAERIDTESRASYTITAQKAKVKSKQKVRRKELRTDWQGQKVSNPRHAGLETATFI